MPRIIRERYENGVLDRAHDRGLEYNALALADARRAYGHCNLLGLVCGHLRP